MARKRSNNKGEVNSVEVSKSPVESHKFHMRKRDLFFIIIVTVSLIVSVWLLLSLTLFPSLSDITSNVPSDVWIIMFLSTIVIVTVFLDIVILLQTTNRDKLRRSWWLIVTLFLMVEVLAVGIYYVSSAFGTPKLDLVLREKGNINNILGSISCKDASGKLLLDNLVTCNITPSLYNLSSKVTFTIDNGSEIQLDFSNLSFMPPPNTNYISFDIDGTDQYNKTLGVVIGYPFRFYTKEEASQRSGEYITYIVFIFGALFAIPSMMSNLKSLTEHGK